MAESTLTFVIFLTGTATVALSIYCAKLFHSKRKQLQGESSKLNKALYLQLLGEAVIGFGTLIFAGLAWLDVLKDTSVFIQSGLRMTMFLATSLTTFHLAKTIKKLDSC